MGWQHRGVAEADVENVALRRREDAVRRLAQLTRGRALTGLSHQEADDVIGTVATDDAHHFDPLPLLRKFYEYGTSVVVIG